jgi:hypothetical protein
MSGMKFVLAFTVALLGCATGPTIRHRPTGPVEGWGVAVLPFDIGYSTTDAERYTRSLAVADHLARTTELQVYGPGEFTFTGAEGDDLRTSTDLAKRVHYTEARTPEKFLALRLSAQQSMHLGPTDRSARVNVLVRAELLSLGTPGVLAAVEGQIAMDSDAQSAGGDNWPGLTKLTSSLVDALAESVAWKSVRKPPTHGLGFIELPRPAFDFHPPTSEEKRALSMVREAQILTAVQGVDPQASVDRRAIYLQEPCGLLLTSVSQHGAEANLLREDVLTDANGDPLFGEYVLLRQLHDGPVRVRVKRAGVPMGAVINP